MEAYLEDHFDVIKFICDAANHLEVSSQPKILACMLYHQYVALQKKFEEKCIEKFLVGATCLYLSAKIEEEPLKIRDLVNVCYRIHHSKNEPLEIGKMYWNLRDSITTCELMLLRLFNFKTSFETPLKYLVHFMKLIHHWCNRCILNKANVYQICFNIMNDLSYLPLICHYSPELLAASVIYTAFQVLALEVPRDINSKEWFEIFCPGTIEENLQSISYEILLLYEFDRNAYSREI
ncbi:cyclin-Q [Hydra vulgaris]|uniref:cyclin-Q n=1 Tax=Hydra vulgaris TaxID=6087 RepID=UPI001F5EF0C1|nr:cyclin-Q [Hydra vulgaris]